MKRLYLRTLYGITDTVFNVGEKGVKTHYEPITNKVYAYGSSPNVKKNVKEMFSAISGIETPNADFKRKASVKNKTIIVNGDGQGEQSGVSISIDVENPHCSIFGAWNSETVRKYAKAAIKACFNVSEFNPVHPLLQHLNDKDIGVFVGDSNSTVSLEISESDNEGLKGVVIKTPEQASEMVGCSIEEAKKVFSSLRPMNCYEDKRTANGIYQETFTINIEAFGKVNLSSYEIPEEVINKLLANGWRIVKIDNEDYLSPSREELIELWRYFVDALIDWDFSSNNSLHGNIKEALRYSFSFNVNKLNNCNMAAMYEDGDKLKARLVLRNHKKVANFNSVLLEKWYICDEQTPLSMDADDEVKDALFEVGKDNII